MDKDALKARAIDVRDKWLAGEITYGEAKVQLKEFIDTYNCISEEIASKYGQKPKKFRVGDFLKYGFLK